LENVRNWKEEKQGTIYSGHLKNCKYIITIFDMLSKRKRILSLTYSRRAEWQNSKKYHLSQAIWLISFMTAQEFHVFRDKRYPTQNKSLNSFLLGNDIFANPLLWIFSITKLRLFRITCSSQNDPSWKRPQGSSSSTPLAIGRATNFHIPIPGCPGPHPTWPWTPPGMVHPQPLWAPHHSHSKELPPDNQPKSLNLKPFPPVPLLCSLVKSWLSSCLEAPFRYWKAYATAMDFYRLFIHTLQRISADNFGHGAATQVGMPINLCSTHHSEKVLFSTSKLTAKGLWDCNIHLSTTSFHPQSPPLRIRMGRATNYLWRTIKDRIDFW